MILYARRYGFFISVVLLQAIYFFTALHFGNICNGDTFEYVYEAVNILERGYFYCGNPVLPIREEYLTLRTPGYPLFIAAVYFFTVNNRIVLLLQSLISLFNIFFARKTFRQLGYGDGMDKWAFLLLLFYPGQFVYANVLSPDILLQTCCVIYFHYGVKFLKDKRSDFALYMSLALTAGLFIKPVLYPFAAIHFLMLVIFGRFRRIISPLLISVSLIPLLCVLLYSYSNKMRTGKFHFSSIQAVNALYNHLTYYYAREGFKVGEAFIAREKQALEQLPTYPQRYEEANRRSLELLRQNFVPYMCYHLTKSGMFFLQTGRGELDQFLGKLTLTEIYAGKSETLTTVIQERKISEFASYAKNNLTTLFAVFIFLGNVLKLAGVFLFLRYGTVLPVIKWFLTLYLLYFALITGPVANAHYTMPVSLIMMYCAVTGYLYGLNRMRKKVPQA